MSLALTIIASCIMLALIGASWWRREGVSAERPASLLIVVPLGIAAFIAWRLSC